MPCLQSSIFALLRVKVKFTKIFWSLRKELDSHLRVAHPPENEMHYLRHPALPSHPLPRVCSAFQWHSDTICPANSPANVFVFCTSCERMRSMFQIEAFTRDLRVLRTTVFVQFQRPPFFVVLCANDSGAFVCLKTNTKEDKEKTVVPFTCV